jgi:peptidoglycan/xylan/chitin deacetylase (PgdA/CDA1 family)
MKAIRGVLGYPQSFIKVLIYHHVPQADMAHVEAQLRYLRRRYHFIDPHRPNEEGRKGIRILLTFDDGFASAKVVAERILDPLGIKAVFFAPAQLLERQSRSEQRRFIARQIYPRLTETELSDEIYFMESGDLLGLASAGHVIGAHTRTHPCLSKIDDPAALHDEIVAVGNELQRALNMPVEWFAYPFGRWDAIHAAGLAMARARYKYCCSAVRGGNADLSGNSCILRDPVAPGDSLRYLRFLVEDGLGHLYYKRARLLAEMWPGARVGPETITI